MDSHHMTHWNKRWRLENVKYCNALFFHLTLESHSPVMHLFICHKSPSHSLRCFHCHHMADGTNAKALKK